MGGRRDDVAGHPVPGARCAVIGHGSARCRRTLSVPAGSGQSQFWSIVAQVVNYHSHLLSDWMAFKPSDAMQMHHSECKIALAGRGVIMLALGENKRTALVYF